MVASCLLSVFFDLAYSNALNILEFKYGEMHTNYLNYP